MYGKFKPYLSVTLSETWSGFISRTKNDFAVRFFLFVIILMFKNIFFIFRVSLSLTNIEGHFKLYKTVFGMSCCMIIFCQLNYFWYCWGYFHNFIFQFLVWAICGSHWTYLSGNEFLLHELPIQESVILTP